MFRIAFGYLAAGIAWMGCGGGTDVDNALVQGQVRDNGTLVASARVTVMREDYNPMMGDPTGRTRTTLTDKDGKFAFPDLPTGNYSLEAVDADERRMDWIPNLSINSGTTVNVVSELLPTRSVIVQLSDSAPANTYLYIPGTTVMAHRDTTGPGARFTLTHVPADSIPLAGLASMDNPAASSMVILALPPGVTDTLITTRK